MDKLIEKIIHYYKQMADTVLITNHEILPRDILSPEEIFEFYLGEADIFITEGKFFDLNKISNIDVKDGFFSHKLKVNAKNFKLNLKNVMESLEQFGINDTDYFIEYKTSEYNIKFSNSKIVATIVYINCKEIARISYSSAISGEQTVDIRNFVEYDLENLLELVDEGAKVQKIFHERLGEEFENYIEDAEVLENLYLIIDRYFLDIQMHQENERYILAYNTLLDAIIRNEYIRIKTGAFSDKYKSNIETISGYYRDIITNMVGKYKEM